MWQTCEGWARLRQGIRCAARLRQTHSTTTAKRVGTGCARRGGSGKAGCRARQAIHYRKNAELVDKTRALLDAKLDLLQRKTRRGNQSWANSHPRLEQSDCSGDGACWG